MHRNYDVIIFISRYLYFKKAESSLFADIVKVVTVFIKTILKDSKKVISIRNYVSKYGLYWYLFIEQNLLISSE